MNPAAVQKVQENAGTGPYESALQSGLTYISPQAESAAVGGYRAAHQARRHLKKLKNSMPRAHDTQLPKTLGDVSNDIHTLIDGTSSPTLNSLGKVALGAIDYLSNLLGAVNTPQLVLKQNIDTVVSKTEVLFEAASSELRAHKGSGVPVFGLKSGVFFQSGATVQFDTLTASSGDQTIGSIDSSFFLTATELFPLGLVNRSSTGRVGVGVANGNPDYFVSTVGAATFLSPYAFDGELGVSLRLPPAIKSEESAKKRTLLDHVRPGDVWLSLTGREITGSSSAALSNGQIAEADVTYAVSLPERYLFRPTTLSLSGIYSADHSLGIDEMGVELRTPINGLRGNRPIYFSARYGSRGHYTLALDFRL